MNVENQTQRIGKNANVQIGNVTGDSVKIAVQRLVNIMLKYVQIP